MLRNQKEHIDMKEMSIHILLFIMISWLLFVAKSATSLAATFIGILMIISLGLPGIKKNPKLIKIYFLVSVIIFMIVHLSFDIFAVVTTSLDRDMTLTGRTELWEDLIKMGTNPLIGTGYESFWLGDRRSFLWAQEQYRWHPNQAHNGYLEIYLNLGFIGLILLTGIIYSVYKNINVKLLSLHDFDYQILRMTFLVVTLIINVTEAYFKGINLLWFIFLLISFDYPHRIDGQST
jgi:O-antigen ligase